MIRAGDGLDATRFRRLASQGCTALNDGDPSHAAHVLRTALDLWRGPAYAEFADCPAIADEAARLKELRSTVSERWAEAELRLGNHGMAVETLSELVRAHPYREDLRGQLMRALYGAGRQADAFDLYRSTWELLVDELGVEPGPLLRRLHERMLRGDAQLAQLPIAAGHTVSADRDGSSGVPVPRELPAEVVGFTGREDALKALAQMLPPAAEGGDRRVEPVVISAIAGMAGVGKTALAVHWARQVADRFPDGQLYLNLQGYAAGRPLRPIEALTALLGGLGVPSQQVPVDVATAAARYRSLVAERRMLMLLDNAASAAQVRPLLPAGHGSLVLVTSRDRLTGLVAHDGARRLVLDVLDPDESMELLLIAVSWRFWWVAAVRIASTLAGFRWRGRGGCVRCWPRR